MLCRPIAAREVAGLLVEVAAGPALGLAPELAGPEDQQLVSMTRWVVRARGLRKIVVPIPMPGAVGRGFRHGGLLPLGDGPRGTATFANGALDTLRLARVRREKYVGPWLPEPIVAWQTPADDPAERVTLDSTVSYALLVVLESLSPPERVAWVLHDLFGMPFPEVAEVVGRTPEAVRQLASRARAHVRSGTPRVALADGEHDRTVLAFLRAAAGGGLGDLIAVLDPRVTLVSDGGGRAMTARRPVLGAEAVARFIAHWAGRVNEGDIETVRVNDALGVTHRVAGEIDSVLAFTVTDGMIVRIDIVRAWNKLPRP